MSTGGEEKEVVRRLVADAKPELFRVWRTVLVELDPEIGSRGSGRLINCLLAYYCKKADPAERLRIYRAGAELYDRMPTVYEKTPGNAPGVAIEEEGKPKNSPKKRKKGG